tara:strand:+ start:459 stop:842 length:384 start_codon:yes stop_codon:yes gene_type:complete
MTSQLNVDTIANKAGSGTVALTKQFALRQWAVFGMDDETIDDSFATSSVTDIGAGEYNVTVTNAFESTKYCIGFLPLYVAGHGTLGMQYNHSGAGTSTVYGVYAARLDTGGTADTTQANVNTVGDLA